MTPFFLYLYPPMGNSMCYCINLDVPEPQVDYFISKEL